ncbi:putative methyltransferase NSUN7 [Ambystoma mexicanum]|uniref:putative methyltransferase NSUN7 n=1 Tax=Ambystoma mexicanum TaxID=8296 RepID=UPI0037E85910
MSLGQSGAPGGALYRGAARIFQALRRREGSRIDYGAEQPPLYPAGENRGELRTAVCALPYQDILEDVLLDSGFLGSQKLPADLTALAMVLLHEFHKRKFTMLPFLGSEEEAGKEVTDVANAIYSHRTKLAAAFARVRIRKEVSSLSCLLSESIQKRQKMAGSVPLCAWINKMKMRTEDVVISLGHLGLSQVQEASVLSGQTFLLDKDYEDVISFPAGLLDQICSSPLFSGKALIVQDKSRCVLAHCARAAMIHAEDVLFTTAGSGLTPVHVAVLRGDEGGKILACGGTGTEANMDELRNLPKNIGVSKMTFIPERFLDMHPSDPRLQKVRVIVLMLVGSASGVLDPTDFLLNEGEDIGLMEHLVHGPAPPHMVNAFADHHLELLLHAMKFPNVHSILYSTSSVHEAENQEVLRQAMTLQSERNSPELAYRLIPPLLSKLSTSEALATSEDPVMQVGPSVDGNGYFLALLTRQGITVKGILARAVKKGLLDKAVLSLPDTEQKEKKDKVIKRGQLVSIAPKQGMAGSPKKTAQHNSRKKQPKQRPTRKKTEGTQGIIDVKDIINRHPSEQKENADDDEDTDILNLDNKAWLWQPGDYNKKNSRELLSSLKTVRLLNRGQYRDADNSRSTRVDLQRSVTCLDASQWSPEEFHRLLEDRPMRRQISTMNPFSKQEEKGPDAHKAAGSRPALIHGALLLDLRGGGHSSAEEELGSKTEKHITVHSKLSCLLPKNKLANSVGTTTNQIQCSSTAGIQGMTPFPPVDNSHDLLSPSLINRPQSARVARDRGWEDIRPLLTKGSQSLNMQRSLGRSQVLSLSQIYLPPPEPDFLNVLKKQRTFALKKSGVQ